MANKNDAQNPFASPADDQTASDDFLVRTMQDDLDDLSAKKVAPSASPSSRKEAPFMHSPQQAKAPVRKAEPQSVAPFFDKAPAVEKSIPSVTQKNSADVLPQKQLVSTNITFAPKLISKEIAPKIVAEKKVAPKKRWFFFKSKEQKIEERKEKIQLAKAVEEKTGLSAKEAEAELAIIRAKALAEEKRFAAAKEEEGLLLGQIKKTEEEKAIFAKKIDEKKAEEENLELDVQAEKEKLASIEEKRVTENSKFIQAKEEEARLSQELKAEEEQAAQLLKNISSERQTLATKKEAEEKLRKESEKIAVDLEVLNAKTAEEERLLSSAKDDEQKLSQQLQRAEEGRRAFAKKIEEEKALLVAKKEEEEKLMLDARRRLEDAKKTPLSIPLSQNAFPERVAPAIEQPALQQKSQPVAVENFADPRFIDRPTVQQSASTNRPAMKTPAESPFENNLSSSRTGDEIYRYILIGTSVIVVAIIALGGYYFWITRTPQQAPATVTEEIPTDQPVSIPTPSVEKYSALTPNYLPIDFAAATSSEISASLLDTASYVQKSSAKVPYEFVITDANNNPLSFSSFANAAGITLAPLTMNNLDEKFSVYFYKDDAVVRMAIAIGSKGDKVSLSNQMLTEEKTLIGSLPVLFLDSKPLIAGAVFNNGLYDNYSIRYFNIDKEKGLSTDYTVTTDKLFIATSKNTLRAVLDKISQKTSAQSSAPTQATVVEAVPSSNTSSAGSITLGQ